MLATTKLALIKTAAGAALKLNLNLNKLLDAYDTYSSANKAETKSEKLKLEDLEVSMRALGTLPHQLANYLDDWTRGVQSELSQPGFEVYVLNEFSIHMFSVETFFRNHSIDTQVDYDEVGGAFACLRNVSRALHK